MSNQQHFAAPQLSTQPPAEDTHSHHSATDPQPRRLSVSQIERQNKFKQHRHPTLLRSVEDADGRTSTTTSFGFSSLDSVFDSYEAPSRNSSGLSSSTSFSRQEDSLPPTSAVGSQQHKTHLAAVQRRLHLAAANTPGQQRSTHARDSGFTGSNQTSMDAQPPSDGLRQSTSGYSLPFSNDTVAPPGLVLQRPHTSSNVDMDSLKKDFASMSMSMPASNPSKVSSASIADAGRAAVSLQQQQQQQQPEASPFAPRSSSAYMQPSSTFYWPASPEEAEDADPTAVWKSAGIIGDDSLMTPTPSSVSQTNGARTAPSMTSTSPATSMPTHARVFASSSHATASHEGNTIPELPFSHPGEGNYFAAPMQHQHQHQHQLPLGMSHQMPEFLDLTVEQLMKEADLSTEEALRAQQQQQQQQHARQSARFHEHESLHLAPSFSSTATIDSSMDFGFHSASSLQDLHGAHQLKQSHGSARDSGTVASVASQQQLMQPGSDSALSLSALSSPESALHFFEQRAHGTTTDNHTHSGQHTPVLANASAFDFQPQRTVARDQQTHRSHDALSNGQDDQPHSKVLIASSRASADKTGSHDQPEPFYPRASMNSTYSNDNGNQQSHRSGDQWQQRGSAEQQSAMFGLHGEVSMPVNYRQASFGSQHPQQHHHYQQHGHGPHVPTPLSGMHQQRFQHSFQQRGHVANGTGQRHPPSYLYGGGQYQQGMMPMDATTTAQAYEPSNHFGYGHMHTLQHQVPPMHPGMGMSHQGFVNANAPTQPRNNSNPHVQGQTHRDMGMSVGSAEMLRHHEHRPDAMNGRPRGKSMEMHRPHDGGRDAHNGNMRRRQTSHHGQHNLGFPLSFANSGTLGTSQGHNNNGHGSNNGRGNPAGTGYQQPRHVSFDPSSRLRDLRGRLLDLSSDQNGSRHIQQCVESASPAEMLEALQELQPKMYTVMVDVFGNYVVQKLLRYGDAGVKEFIVQQALGKVASLSLHNYGCRVVQEVIASVTDADLRRQVLDELKSANVLKLIKHQHANHVIQKCVTTLPKPLLSFIIHACQDEAPGLSCHLYGCRVIQRLIEQCEPEQLHVLYDNVLASCSNLTRDAYGNYVIQHVINHGRECHRERVMAYVSGNVLTMSKHKFASNVIEKFLRKAAGEQLAELIAEVCRRVQLPDGTSNAPLHIMMKDKYANYVVQTMIETAPRDAQYALLQYIQANSEVLKTYTYGKHIVSKAENILRTMRN